MAGNTIFAKLPAVCIFGRMTTITVRGRTFKFSISMAGLAVNIRMLSGQGKTGELAVIEIHIPPTTCVMALGTIFAKLAVMLVILLMA